MSLIRTGFVLACGVALMPADKAGQKQVFTQAAQAAGWATSYCEREQAKCEQAAALWEGFKEKAVFAGRLALEATQKYAAGPALASSEETPAVAEYQTIVATNAHYITGNRIAWSRNTLTSDDLLPAWRGPQKH